MKKSLKVILAGLSTFISGIIFMIIIDVFAGSYYELRGLDATIIAIGLVSAGLSTIGITIMYEFVRRKYEVRK